MPEIQIPETYTLIKWPDRKKGVVRIRSLLPLLADHRLPEGVQVVQPSLEVLKKCFPKRREGKPSSPVIMVKHKLFIPIELTFHRQPFCERLAIIEAAQLIDIALQPHQTDENMDSSKTREPKRKVFNNISGDTLIEVQKILTSLWGKYPAFPNDPLTFLDDWANSISITLATYAEEHGSPNHSRDQSLGLPSREESRFWWKKQVLHSMHSGLKFKLSLSRHYLPILDFLLGVKGRLDQLKLDVRWNLLPHILANWALRGIPRGPKARGQFLMPVAKAALLAANELVLRATEDKNLQWKILAIMGTDNFGKVLLQVAQEDEKDPQKIQRLTVIFLANRTLKPAWNKYKITPLTERDYTQAYAEFLDPESVRIMKGAFRLPQTKSRWFHRLLGPEGQAARDFGFL